MKIKIRTVEREYLKVFISVSILNFILRFLSPPALQLSQKDREWSCSADWGGRHQWHPEWQPGQSQHWKPPLTTNYTTKHSSKISVKPRLVLLNQQTMTWQWKQCFVFYNWLQVYLFILSEGWYKLETFTFFTFSFILNVVI